MKKSNSLEVFKKFWKIDKWYVILFLIGKIKDVPRPLMYALCTKFLIDGLSRKENFMSIVFLLFLFLFIEVLMIFYDAWLNNGYCAKKQEEISKILMSEFLEKISKVPLKYFEDTEFSNKNSLATNELIQTYFNLFTYHMDIFVNVLSMITLIVFVFSINIFIIMSAIVALILYFLVNNKISKIKLLKERAIIPFERYKKYFAYILSTYDDVLNIRLHMSEKYFITKWKENSDKIVNIIKKFSGKSLVYGGLNNNIFPLFQYTVMAYTAYIVWIGKITVGSFSALLQSTISFINQMRRCSEIIAQMTKYSSNLKIIKEIDLYVVEENDNKSGLVLDTNKQHVIEFKNLNFSYKSFENNILNNISFKINPGEKIAIVGDNGSGKSTLINLLLRLYNPPHGTIFINNIDINKYDIKSFRKNFSVVMQNQANYAITVLENIVLKNKTENLDVNKINESLKNSLIYDKVTSHNKGIFSSISKKFDNDGLALSGGENQKLNMSRFFNKYSPILVLDEYEKWLDSNSNKIILKHIMNFSKNKTLIIVTHDEKILALMNKVVTLKNGTVESIIQQN